MVPRKLNLFCLEVKFALPKGFHEVIWGAQEVKFGLPRGEIWGAQRYPGDDI